MRLAALAVISALTFSAFPVIAETGDAAAVEQYCGAPSSEQQGVSPVTNRMERNLTYGTFILHFEPAADGWTFLSGWYDHLPMTEKMVEGRMPCFAQAMAAARAEHPAGPYEDPAVRSEIAAPAADTTAFGIPHLWLILLLVVIVLFFVLLPSRGRQSRQPEGIGQTRYRRKPAMDRFFRRKPGTGLDV